MTPPVGYPQSLPIAFPCACYSLAFCLLASFVPLWLTAEFPKPGQSNAARNQCNMAVYTLHATWKKLMLEACQDPWMFVCCEFVNVAFDGRMTGTGYLGENTLLMVELG